ncbi:MAG: uracil phosphoribosyltransferase [Bacteroidales bacterium]|nr:uracil phosphoribosyltransferase [Bacteroidales bacterium]
MVKNLGANNTILNSFLAEIRCVKVQEDSMRFRRNMERLGEIFAYEISKTLDYKTVDVHTPLGEASMSVVSEQPVLGTILRAGLPLHQGVLNYFDRSENAFISAFRRHYKDGSFEIKIDYMSSPVLNDRVMILVDPMLATGQSMVLTIKEILANHGKPKHIHIVSAIASSEGVDYVKRHMGGVQYTIWTAAIDDELTAQAYIVPGLGDAGDLAYGTKTCE